MPHSGARHLAQFKVKMWITLIGIARRPGRPNHLPTAYVVPSLNEKAAQVCVLCKKYPVRITTACCAKDSLPPYPKAKSDEDVSAVVRVGMTHKLDNPICNCKNGCTWCRVQVDALMWSAAAISCHSETSAIDRSKAACILEAVKTNLHLLQRIAE